MASTQQLLLESVDAIAQLGRGAPEEASEKSKEAFNNFRKGVTQASGGRDATPEELLGDLQPKDSVLWFLSELYEKKRMYRKQIEAVWLVLLQVGSWLDALQGDETLCSALPEELRSVFEEEAKKAQEEAAAAAAKPKPAPPAEELPVKETLEPAGAASGAVEAAPPATALRPPSPTSSASPVAAVSSAASAEAVPEIVPTGSDIRRAADAARDRIAQEEAETRRRLGMQAHKAEDPLVLLDKAVMQMKAVEYSAIDRDASCEAFESFRKAVMKVVNSSTKDDDEVLEQLAGKDLILSFLVSVHEHQRRLKNQVKSICVRLREFDGWRVAIENDVSVNTFVQEIINDTANPVTSSLSAPEPSSEMKAQALELKNTASLAKSRGGIGAFWVHVVAANRLPSVVDARDHCEPYVRVTLGLRTKRTEDNSERSNPRWKAAPMVFEVPSWDSCIRFDVLHSDTDKDIPFGCLELKCCDVARVDPAATPASRFALTGRSPAGELVLRLTFAAAEGCAISSMATLLGDNPGAAASDQSTEASASPRPSAPLPAAVAAASADATGGEPRWVAWLSLDPRKGEFQPYRPDVASKLELHWSKGDEAVDISEAIPGATLVFRPYLQQRTKNGSRHVCRMELQMRGGEVKIPVDRGDHGEWRVSRNSSAPDTKTVYIQEYEAVELLALAASLGDSVRSIRNSTPAQIYDWVPIQRGQPLPSGAVLAGQTRTDGEVYVGRNADGEAGKINLEGGKMWNLWCHRSGESSSAAVLVLRPGALVEWRAFKEGDLLPEAAIEAGHPKEDGNPVFVARESGGACGKLTITDDRKIKRLWCHHSGLGSMLDFGKKEGELLLVSRGAASRPSGGKGGGQGYPGWAVAAACGR